MIIFSVIASVLVLGALLVLLLALLFNRMHINERTRWHTDEDISQYVLDKYREWEKGQ